MSRIFEDSPTRAFGADLTLRALLAEYDALYGLLRFRLEAMDRRLPVAAAAIGAALAGIPTMQPASRVVILLLLPPGLAWLVGTATGHARSKEDHLRRIAEIEETVNEIAGRELLQFQSTHPSRGKFVSGRSGQISVLATASGALAALVACGVFYWTANPIPPTITVYFAYLTAVATSILRSLLRLGRYRYTKSPPRPRLVGP